MEREHCSKYGEFEKRGALSEGNDRISPDYHRWFPAPSETFRCPLPNAIHSPTSLSISPIWNLFKDFILKVSIYQQHFRENNEEIICIAWELNYSRWNWQGRSNWGENAFEELSPNWLSYLQALKFQGVIACKGEAKEGFTDSYTLFLEHVLLHLVPLVTSGWGLWACHNV